MPIRIICRFLRQFSLFKHCNLLKMGFDLSTLIVAIVDIFFFSQHEKSNIHGCDKFGRRRLVSIEQYETNNSH